MRLTTLCYYWAQFAVLFDQLINNAAHYRCVFVCYFDIINILNHAALVFVNMLISQALVMGVDFESLLFQRARQFLLDPYGSLERLVQSLGKFQVQGLLTILSTGSS